MNLLRVENLSFSYKNSPIKLLNEFSFVLQKNEFCAIIGQNGSGKSTFLKLLSRQCVPTGGHIFLQEMPFEHIKPMQMSRWIISLTQRMDQSLFFEMSVSENVEIWIQRLPSAQRSHATMLLERSYYYERILKLWHRPVSALSGGEQQILMFTLAFISEPKVLLLDEHTSQLDPQMSSSIMLHIAQNAKEKQIGVIMVTHNIQHAIDYADRILIMKEGLAPVEIINDSTLTPEVLKSAIL